MHHRRYGMRALPVVAGCLFLLAGCLPPQPGPTYAEYRPVPVRHEVRPAPRPVPRPEVRKAAPAPRPQVHKSAPAPRPQVHKSVPAPRPDRQVKPSRPDGKKAPSVQQRPAPDRKGQADRRPDSGRNEPGGRGPGRSSSGAVSHRQPHLRAFLKRRSTSVFPEGLFP